MDLSSFNLPHHSVLLKWALTLIGIVILGAIFVGGYGGLSKVMELLNLSSATYKPVALTGNLVASIATVSTTTGKYTGIHLFVINTSDGTGSYVPADLLTGGLAMTLQYNISSNGNYATFLGAPYEHVSSSTISVAENLGVYKANLSNAKDYASNLLALQTAPVVSSPNEADYFREFPTVSSIGDVLYSSLSAKTYAISSSTLGNLSADNWNIMMVDSSGAVHVITQGLRPKWVDATHFAYLKNDGIYLYDLVGKGESQIIAWDQQITIANGFDVSDDATYVAFSDPSGNKLRVYHILNWTGGIAPAVDQLEDIVATELTFSPNDDYLAALTSTQLEDSSGSISTVLGYYSLAHHAFVGPSYPIDPYLFGTLRMSDWRQ